MVLSSGAVFGLSGCCDDVCDAADDLKANVAAGYAICCQTESEEAGWSDCVQDANSRNQDMRDTLLAAQAACENGDNDLMEELLRDFYQILRGRIVEAVGPTALRSGNPIANTYVILEPTDQISIAFTALSTISSVVKTQPMLVNGELYTAESGGVAIEAQTLLSVDGVAPAASILPVMNMDAQQYQFDPSGSITVLAGPFERTLGVVKGRLTITELLSGDQSKLVPTDMVLTLQGDGITTTLTLEETCPYNELVLDANGDGYLGMAVSLSSASEALTRISQLGAFWMMLPVSEDVTGQLVFDTSGWSIGTEVFPIQPATMAIALGQTGNAGSLPNGRDESCADADGNGIRDGADEIINIYDNLGGCN